MVKEPEPEEFRPEDLDRKSPIQRPVKPEAGSQEWLGKIRRNAAEDRENSDVNPFTGLRRQK